jgi:hypothetical protein
MATVWKFAIPIADEFALLMPGAVELLFVATQAEQGCLWARVEPQNPIEQRRFKLRGTGHDVDFRSRHIGSFMLRGGALVFHLFETPKSAADV